MSVIGEMGDLAVERARVEVSRSGLGAQLCSYRTAAGISQPQLGQALGRTWSLTPRSSTASVGARGVVDDPDELCGAEGALITGSPSWRRSRRTTGTGAAPTPSSRPRPS